MPRWLNDFRLRVVLGMLEMSTKGVEVQESRHSETFPQ
jgi:hypothetical protein